MSTPSLSARGLDRSNIDISPAVWDEKLRLWTRTGTQKPSTLNSEIDHSLEPQMEPVSNAKDPSLTGHPASDKDSSNEMAFLTASTMDDDFSQENIMNAAGRAWLSSLVHIPNDQVKDVSPVNWIQRENRAQETSQLLLGVESLCSHLDTWDAVKVQGHECDTLPNNRSQSLNYGQPFTAQMLNPDEDKECTRIHEDYFVEPQTFCPPFTSPWFNPKAHIFSDGSLDWTGGEAIDSADMDAQGFDGVGLRQESNRVTSRKHWNGDDEYSSERNVRRRTVDLVQQNIIANEFLDNYDGFSPGDNLPRWFPQPGDIMVTNRSRDPTHLSPGGHVTLYKDPTFFCYIGESRQLRTTQYDFGDGDFVIRLGKFSVDWKWHPSPLIEAFLCDLHQVSPWWLVARTYNNALRPPVYQYDEEFHAPVNAVDRNFRPREGDLIVRAVPGEHNWGLYWWTNYFNSRPCDSVIRAGYEIRANGTCMVVELYYRELDDRDWSFRGRDVWTYLAPGPLYG
ncbi:unnamed protein product [Calypogeia fissa]